MPIRNILVALDGSPSSDTALGAAVAMQRAYDAHLTGYIAPGDEVRAGEVNTWLPKAIRKTLEEAVAGRVKAIEAAFRAATGPLTESRIHLIERRHATDTSVAEASRYFDVTLVGIGDGRSRRSHLHPDRIALLGGHPVLAFPEGVDTSRIAARAIVAWDGSRAAARALSSAVRLLKTKDSVTIVTVGRPVVTDASGLDPQTMLGRHGIVSEWVSIARDSGGVAATILGESARRGAGLLIMGAYEHSKFREDLFGGVTHDILAATRIPVFLEH